MPYNVYIIELDDRVKEIARFQQRNPQMRMYLKCFYVGQTSLDPRERFEQHKNGYKSNRYVKKYGKWIRWKMFQKYNPIGTREEAEVIEEQLALWLQSKGHGVWWG